MAYVPNSGSVAAWLQSDNASVITVGQGSVATVIVGGSILTSSTANQSVSGAVQIAGASPASIMTVTRLDNQVIGSMQGLVGQVVIHGLTSAGGGSYVDVKVDPSGALVTALGSVVAFQGTTPWTIGSVYGNISGSVAAFPQGNYSTIGVQQGSIAAVIIGGSIATATTNSSVMLLNSANVIGSVTALQGTSPWLVSSVYGNISGSIAGTYVNSAVASTVTGVAMMFKQNVSSSIMTEISPTFPLPVTGAVAASISGVVNIAGSVAATITNTNVNVSGSVAAFQAGTQITSVSGQVTVVSSLAGGIFPVSGSVAATIVGTPNVNTAGSVVAFQGTSPWVANFQNSSLFAAQQGTWRVSVAGSYAQGAASVVSGLGIQTLGVRNDTLASVLALNAQYSPFTVGSWGDQIMSYAPSSVWTSGIASCFTGVEQPVITSVLGRRVNVTGVQIANASANNVYLTFYGAGIGSVTGSVIGYTVAPANGGSNINYPIPLQTANNSGFSASVSGVASVFLSAQGFYSAV